MNEPRLLPLLNSVSNQIGLCVLTLLGWLMMSDGIEDPEETKMFSDIAESSGLHSLKDQLLEFIRAGDLTSIELASEILARELNNEDKLKLIELYFGMLLADGFITLSERYVIGFIADLFSIAPENLDSIFFHLSGKKLSAIGDPSSISWWNQKESQKQDRYSSNNHRKEGNKFIQAYAILGLEEGATLEEIKSAYRRLAKIHHPDRYQSLGKEAVEAAHQTFVRITNAYELLIKS